MRWHLLMLLSCFVGGCAGTSGLAALREQLGGVGVHAPVGRVVDGELVHEASGVRLVRVPADGWQPNDPGNAPALLFTGRPGIAMMLGWGQVGLVRMQGKDLEVAPVFDSVEPPPLTQVMTLEYTKAPGNAEPRDTTVQLVVPQFERGVSATMSGVRLSLDVDGGSGAALHFSTGALLPGERCSETYTTTLERGSRDGATWFRLASVVTQRIAHTQCTDAMRAALPTEPSDGSSYFLRREDLWVVFPDGGGAPRVTSSEIYEDRDAGSKSMESTMFEALDGVLQFSREMDYVRDGGVLYWKWTLFDAAGVPFELASGN